MYSTHSVQLNFFDVPIPNNTVLRVQTKMLCTTYFSSFTCHFDIS